MGVDDPDSVVTSTTGSTCTRVMLTADNAARTVCRSESRRCTSFLKGWGRSSHHLLFFCCSPSWCGRAELSIGVRARA